MDDTSEVDLSPEKLSRMRDETLSYLLSKPSSSSATYPHLSLLLRTDARILLNICRKMAIKAPTTICNKLTQAFLQLITEEDKSLTVRKKKEDVREIRFATNHFYFFI
jgi:hypothetical protein